MTACRPWGSGHPDRKVWAGEVSLMQKLSTLREFWEFLRTRKKWWLTPIVVLLVLLGTLIVLTEGSALAPFIYALF
jgi:hypothetical protein